MIVGICGKSGSGKSTLSKELVKMDNRFIHCDIDKIGHKIYENNIVRGELINAFGNNVVKNGVVDRVYLRNIVFKDSDSMKELENITWKYMKKEIDKFINNNKDKIIIFDWLLLYKTEYFNLCDIKILLDIPYEVRKKRVLLRDNISEKDFLLRDNASDIYDYCLFDIILNNNDVSVVKRMVLEYE